jgi:restriction endonuclease Mrr
MAELSEMLIFQKLTEGKSSFNINEIYAPILIIMIIWYLLTNKSNNICQNCSNPIKPVTTLQMQNIQQNPNIIREKYLENIKAIEFNPYGF